MDNIHDIHEWYDIVLNNFLLFILIPLGLALSFSAFRIRQRRRISGILRAVAIAVQAKGIPLYRHTNVRLVQELMRARRYHHPVTVVVMGFQVDYHETSMLGQENSDEAIRDNLDVFAKSTFLLTFPLVGAILCESLRDSDIVSYDATSNEFVIFFIESTKAQVEQAIKRLRALLAQRTHLPLYFGLAEFPIDGFTHDELVTRARESTNRVPERSS